MIYPHPLHDAVRTHPYPLLFATVSGAHLYGFPSPDSDWDLRGVHVLPAREVLGLHPIRETIDSDRVVGGLELDLVTHDLRKFMALMLKPNGYVLEQLHSPLVVLTTREHAELRDLGRRCVTRHHAHHYLGFSAGQWKLLNRDDPPRIKPLLYTFRTLLTGLHLMRTGEIEANLEVLNTETRLPYLDDLIAQKRTGHEKEPLTGDLGFYETEFRRLTRQLEEAQVATHLPANVEPEVEAELSDLLVRLRLPI
ncbi:nucleotidyltransferase domain-containing protein [Deinococcus aquiradiocola]|uniref:Nucleotidyltransferase n=1 Tax=Deinococcus aquiradiocola TaxID=393059 RepID=A0A917P9R8_9DEIO|nr:nucleotidyltransferase domain-containing protein [Deinococcus aquiradiocola]GGJ67939.1 nucleotidyltransferase [Deinococcus aquiradiocola]